MAISTAIGASTVSRVLGIKTAFTDTNIGGVLYLPQRIAVIGQGASAAAYSLDKKQIFSAYEAGETYGFGSPIHLAARQLLPDNGDGVGTIPVTVYPLRDNESGVAAAGVISPSGTVTKAGAFSVSVNGETSAAFSLAVGDTGAAIANKIINAVNGVLSMPVIASLATTTAALTAKWDGTSGNDLLITINGPTDTGVTFGITQPTGGLVNPAIDGALARIGDVWESMVINCLEATDSDALDAFDVEGEGRWGALRRKPFIAFTGASFTEVSTATAITDTRKTQRTNVLLNNPGSASLPCAIAAGMVAKIALVANSNPARDFGRQVAAYILPGADADQWNFAQRDTAVQSGVSTVEVRDDEVNISDTVTMFRPDGDANPAYRFVKDLVKLQNIIYNLSLIFSTAAWDGAPLIPDDQPTVNPDAKKPKNAVSALYALADSLGADALISDLAYTKAGTAAQINSQNPNRLDVAFPVKLSGNTNIISLDLNFGFYFGVNQVIN